MTDVTRIDSSKRLSRAVVHNGTVYLSGMTASDRSLDIRGQARQMFEKIEDYLRQAGSDKGKILSAQVWLQEIDRDFAAFNEEWESWVPSDAVPARAACQTRLIAKDCLVEVMIVAYV